VFFDDPQTLRFNQIWQQEKTEIKKLKKNPSIFLATYLKHA
jgi:hypothetical protein